MNISFSLLNCKSGKGVFWSPSFNNLRDLASCSFVFKITCCLSTVTGCHVLLPFVSRVVSVLCFSVKSRVVSVLSRVVTCCLMCCLGAAFLLSHVLSQCCHGMSRVVTCCLTCCLSAAFLLNDVLSLVSRYVSCPGLSNRRDGGMGTSDVPAFISCVR